MHTAKVHTAIIINAIATIIIPNYGILSHFWIFRKDLLKNKINFLNTFTQSCMRLVSLYLHTVSPLTLLATLALHTCHLHYISALISKIYISQSYKCFCRTVWNSCSKSLWSRRCSFLMSNSVTERFAGNIIGCFCDSGISARTNLPSTLMIPTWSRYGL